MDRAASPLKLLETRLDILGDAGDSSFGTLLCDGEGVIAQDADGQTWLYTAARDDRGRWGSHARPFNTLTLEAGPALPVLSLGSGDTWAVIHYAVRLRADLYCALYSCGSGIRAAFSARPDTPFVRDEAFRLDPVVGWETLNEPLPGWSLEVNNGAVTIHEDGDRLELWALYDSYFLGRYRGELGWVRLTFDKRSGRVILGERHQDNPLKLLKPGYLCARCGGNLSSPLRVGGRFALPYYARRSPQHCELWLALSDDPLFQTIEAEFVFDAVQPPEEVMEKFLGYQSGDTLTLLYDSRWADGSWHTGMRRYHNPQG